MKLHFEVLDAGMPNCFYEMANEAVVRWTRWALAGWSGEGGKRPIDDG